jgi:hypothetical protein
MAHLLKICYSTIKVIIALCFATSPSFCGDLPTDEPDYDADMEKFFADNPEFFKAYEEYLSQEMDWSQGVEYPPEESSEVVPPPAVASDE